MRRTVAHVNRLCAQKNPQCICPNCKCSKTKAVLWQFFRASLKFCMSRTVAHVHRLQRRFALSPQSIQIHAFFWFLCSPWRLFVFHWQRLEKMSSSVQSALCTFWPCTRSPGNVLWEFKSLCLATAISLQSCAHMHSRKRQLWSSSERVLNQKQLGWENQGWATQFLWGPTSTVP